MKKIINYFGILLSVALLGAFSACTPKEIIDADAAGLGIKTFFPTKVVTNQPVIINGTGFGNVREVVFPGGVSVTDIEHVGNGMIRVTTPAGIAAEGGKLIVRTTDDQAESKQELTLGNTVVSGFSKQDGEEIEGGQQLSVYGTDLEFICRAELIDPDGNPLILEDEDFYRKGTSLVIITIPRKIFEGTWVGKLYTFDGKEIDLPELTYKKPTSGGHWELVKTVFWTNPDPEGNGVVNWNSKYRFCLEGTDTNPDGPECLAELPADIWERMKTEPFYMTAQGSDWIQMRIVTGWWNNQWPDGKDVDITTGNERIIYNEDGTYYIEIDLKGYDIVDVMDKEHFLFTGSGYTPLELYYYEEVWVEEEGGDTEPTEVVFWTNDDPEGNGVVNWNGKYRFCLEGTDTNPDGPECLAELPADIWERMKNEPFYLLAQGSSWVQMRIVTGWWNYQWPDGSEVDITTGNERIINNDDGTYYIKIDLKGYEIVDNMDKEHFLFTGSGYTPLKLFFLEGGELPDGGGGGGDTPGGDDTPIDMEGEVIWSQETAFADWSATIAIPASKFATVQEGDVIRVYIKDKTGEFNPVFKHAEDWSDWPAFVRVDGDNYFEAVVPAEAVDELKEKGLRFQGIGFTLVGVTLIQPTPESPINVEGTVLFDTETAFDSWSATIVVPAEKFANVQEGDIIRVYFKNKSSDYNPVFKHAEDWSDWPEFVRVDGDNYFEAAVPAEAIDELKTKGLRFQGIGFTLVAVSLIQGGSAVQPEGTILFDTETAFDSWSATIVVDPAKFADVKAGDIIRVYIKDKGADYNPIFKHVNDWSDWLEFRRVDGDGYFEAVVLADAIDELKSTGLRFQGIGFTLVAVTLIPYSVTLWEGESVFDGWSATLVVDPDKFADVQAGNVIRVYIKDKGADFNAIIKHVADWSDWAELQNNKADGDGYFEAPVPAEAVDELKSSGLRFQGVGFTITKVVLL